MKSTGLPLGGRTLFPETSTTSCVPAPSSMSAVPSVFRRTSFAPANRAGSTTELPTCSACARQTGS
jgi:hypothetical protein